ncbi:MAG: hypothetical protein JJU40_04490 [Rhodobacteraceae bacterium]|nr:hypothetical protein [Paracoccaceae bacterium]
MTDLALTQFLIDISRGQAKARFAENPEAVLAECDLPERQIAAIREQSIAALWADGAHPMSLLYFARSCGWSAQKYYECISQSESATSMTQK